MAAALFTYTLPTLQLVCHLVTTGNSSIGTTTPGIIDLLPSTPARALPPGYIAYPDFDVAYKVHNESVTWDVAKDICVQEGAYLAVLDSSAKIELVKTHPAAEGEYVHVGLHLRDGDDSTWYSVSSELPILNLPWGPHEPNGIGRCAKILPSEIGLGNFVCDVRNPFVCQISYP